jgi:hypothetical protein
VNRTERDADGGAVTARERAELAVSLAALLPGSVEAAIERPQVAPLGMDIPHAIRTTVRTLYCALVVDYRAAGRPSGAGGRRRWIGELAGVGRTWN